MKTAFMLPCRDKLRGIEQSVRSVLAQSHTGMELIFSDQGSTDGTREAIKSLCATYDGPNTVRILDCPDTEPTGMSGLNAHYNWIASQTDADLLICASADDVNDRDRALKLSRAYEETGASIVSNAIQFYQDDGEVFTTIYPTQSGFVTGAEILHKMVGGSTAAAWDHSFFDKIGGVHGPICNDIYPPYLATQEKGFYYLHDLLYFLHRVPDKKNTGLGGRQMAAETEEEKLQLAELVQYQFASTFKAIFHACNKLYPDTWNENDKQMLLNYMIVTANGWADARDALTAKKINPLGIHS